MSSALESSGSEPRSLDVSLSQEVLHGLEATPPIEDEFIVNQVPADTWRLLARTEQIASCLPGFETLSIEGDHVSGRLHLAFGSIRATFAVRAEIERADESTSCMVTGIGEEERSRTRAHGRLRYRVLAVDDDPSASRVAVSLRFVLQGPLAHFARGGLVREFTSRLVRSFAANLDALAREETPPKTVAPSLGVGTIAKEILLERLARSWLGRFRRSLVKR